MALSTSHLRRVPSDGLPDRGPDTEELLARRVALAFAPLHKRAFGVATGAAGAFFMLLLTTVALVTGAGQRFPLYLIGEYFAGYTVSWPGAFVGAAWGFAVGFVAGWFFAFSRNLALAITAFAYRTKAEMEQTRDFLDHI
jgi:hypothetical protein